MKNLFLFDLDGTLLDTLEDLAAATNHILRKYGYPPRSTEEIRALLGNGAHYQLRCALPGPVPEEQLQAYLADYTRYYEAHCQEHTRPYPGIEDMLASLQQHGARVAILSNKPDGATKQLCARYFPGIPAQGQTAQVRRKPAPDGVLALMAQMKAKPEETVYVGDSEVDLLTAQNSGIDSILVCWGFRSRQALEEAGAKRIVDRPEEILEALL